MNLWDLMATSMDEVPTLTKEEQERITRVHNELQEKHDPVAAQIRKNRTIPLFSPKHYQDHNEKLHHAERTGGLRKRK